MNPSPNDSAHRHGNTNPTPAERAAKLQQATEEVHEAVFGAASCSAPSPPLTYEQITQSMKGGNFLEPCLTLVTP